MEVNFQKVKRHLTHHDRSTNMQSLLPQPFECGSTLILVIQHQESAALPYLEAQNVAHSHMLSICILKNREHVLTASRHGSWSNRLVKSSSTPHKTSTTNSIFEKASIS